MIQRGEHLGFTSEPGEPIGIMRKGFRQYFDCDASIELRVARAIDFAHSALANLCADFVTAKFCAYCESHCHDCGTAIAWAADALTTEQDQNAGNDTQYAQAGGHR